MSNKPPLQSKIERVELVNFKGTHKIDLSAQIAQMEFYESLNSTIQQAVFTLYDPIGLFNNFPLIGEELVLVTFKNSEKYNQNSTDTFTTLAYVIDEIGSITPSDRNRDVSYIMKLSSFVSFVDNQMTVQKAYNGKMSEIAEQLFIDYITKPLNNIKKNGFLYALSKTSTLYYTLRNIESTYSNDSGTIIIPNMRPLDALEWLAAKAIPENPKESSIVSFWAGMNGYHFESLQGLFEKDIQREFTYYADNEIVNQLGEAEKDAAITNITINNRILCDTKTIMGYFQNSLMEINMMEQKYKFTKTEFEDFHKTIEENKKTNTQDYIDTVKVSEDDVRDGSTMEKVNRVHYITNNRTTTDNITPLQNYNENWGNKVRSASAFGQVDLHITVPGDMNIAAGDIIKVKIPKMEGFNAGEGNNDDKFIIGKYIVTDVKNLFLTTGSIHSTVLRINKDTWYNDPDSVEFKYGEGGDFSISPVSTSDF